MNNALRLTKPSTCNLMLTLASLEEPKVEHEFHKSLFSGSCGSKTYRFYMWRKPPLSYVMGHYDLGTTNFPLLPRWGWKAFSTRPMNYFPKYDELHSFLLSIGSGCWMEEEELRVQKHLCCYEMIMLPLAKAKT